MVMRGGLRVGASADTIGHCQILSDMLSDILSDTTGVLHACNKRTETTSLQKLTSAKGRAHASCCCTPRTVCGHAFCNACLLVLQVQQFDIQVEWLGRNRAGMLSELDVTAGDCARSRLGALKAAGAGRGSITPEALRLLLPYIQVHCVLCHGCAARTYVCASCYLPVNPQPLLLPEPGLSHFQAYVASSYKWAL